MDKLWYIHMMKYYWVTKGNEILLYNSMDKSEKYIEQKKPEKKMLFQLYEIQEQAKWIYVIETRTVIASVEGWSGGEDVVTDWKGVWRTT